MEKRNSKLKLFSANIGYILKRVSEMNFLLIFVIFFEAICSATMPFLLLFLSRNVINSLSQMQDIQNATWILLGFSIMYLICYTLKQFLGWQRSLMCMKLYDAFSIELAQKATEMELLAMEDELNLNQYHKAEKSIWFATIGLCAIMASLVSNVVQLIGLTYMFAYMNGWLIILFGCLMLIHIMAEKNCKAKIYENASDCATYERKVKYLSKVMIGAKEGIDLRLFNAEGRMLDEFNKNQYKYLEKTNNNIAIEKRQTTVDLFLTLIFRLVIWCYFVFQFVEDRISIGDFSMVLLATETLYNLLINIPATLLNTWNYGLYVWDYREYINQPVQKSNASSSERVTTDCPVLSFDHVYFRYPNAKEAALSDISITIPYGQKVTIIGDNGSGKSTFIKVLMGLYIPEKGNVVLNDINIQKYDYGKYVNLFSIVFQDFRIFEFSIADNIYLGTTISAEKEQLFWDSLKQSGLYNRVKNLPREAETSVFRNFDENGVLLSGGEQQKLAIARALFYDRKIFIFDEPTASLDSKSEQNFYREMNSFTKGKTVIYISHNMASCVHSDRIIVFEEGRIVADGKHKDLLQSSNVYQKMWNAQAQHYLDIN